MDPTLRLVVLDVDGTLVDSERDGHRVAFNTAFEDFGLPYRWDVDEYGGLLAIAGGERRLDVFLEREGVPRPERAELVRRLHARKTEVFQTLIAEGAVLPRPGVAELLDELRDEGVRLAVATTGTRTWVEPLLARLFGLDRFEAVVAGDDVPLRKPDPGAHLRAVELAGLDPGPGVVAVEDSRNGLVAAKAARLTCVVVLNDYTAHEDMSGADLVLDGFGGDGVAKVVADPRGVGADGRLDVAALRRAAALAAGG